MNSPTPEKDELERQLNDALEDLAFRRDLYKYLEDRHKLQNSELGKTRKQRNAALDALRSIENIAANHPDMPLLALDSIMMTARKILASPDESPTN